MGIFNCQVQDKSLVKFGKISSEDLKLLLKVLKATQPPYGKPFEIIDLPNATGDTYDEVPAPI